MTVELITEQSVRAALSALRAGRSLARNPLIRSGLVTSQLGESGIADLPAAREVALGSLIESVVHDNLEAARSGATGVRSKVAADPLHEGDTGSAADNLRADFTSANVEREAWSVVHYRFLAPQRLTMSQMAVLLRVPRRTLGRRQESGYRLLTQELRVRALSEAEFAGSPCVLPADVTSFVGRAAELATLGARLVDPRCRLVTLVGPGGTGKTRLAVEAARRYRTSFRGGVYFVPASATRSWDDLVYLICQVIDLKLDPTADAAEQLRSHFRTTEVLVLLDGFEHLSASAANLVELLKQGSGAQFMVTSRAPLGVQAEWRVPVTGLSYAEGDSAAPDECAELFEERARQVVPEFRIAPDYSTAVSSIARMVGGLPLAVELAAAQTHERDCPAIAESIRAGLEILATTMSDVPERQRSIRVVIDGTWDQLSPVERGVWSALSVFDDGFTLSAAEAVCGATAEVLSCLTERFAVRQSGDRFQMHDILRHYASARLAESGRESESRERHLEYLIDFAVTQQARYRGPESGAAIDAMRADYANAVAALGYAVATLSSDRALKLAAALRVYWMLSARLAEGRQLCDSVLALPSDPSTARDRLLVALGTSGLATMQGHLEDARKIQQWCVDESRAIGDDSLLAATLSNLGVTASDTGDSAVARQCFEESIEIGRRLDDTRRVAVCLSDLGLLEAELGRYEDAARYYDEALTIVTETGDRLEIATVLGHLGDLAHDQGQIETAAELYGRSLDIYRVIDDSFGMAVLEVNLANLAVDSGDLSRAQALSDSSAERCAEMGNDRLLGDIVDTMGRLAAVSGAYARGLTLLSAADALREGLSVTIGLGYRARHDSAVALCRASLPGEAAVAAVEAGRGMTLDDALALAFQR